MRAFTMFESGFETSQLSHWDKQWMTILFKCEAGECPEVEQAIDYLKKTATDRQK